MINRELDFIAVLKYRTTEEGGRKGPAFSGYRPPVKFDFSDMQTSGEQTFIGKNAAYPGDVVEAEIRILSVEFFENSLEKGMTFEFNEGATNIGTGMIKEIINKKLQKHL